jgi:hypothetical protein
MHAAVVHYFDGGSFPVGLFSNCKKSRSVIAASGGTILVSAAVKSDY